MRFPHCAAQDLHDGHRARHGDLHARCSGDVLATTTCRTSTPEAVAAAAAELTGEIEQVPPMVSAVKSGDAGCTSWPARALRWDRPARTVTVSRFDTTPDAERPGVYRAEVVCSSWHLHPVLAHDLGGPSVGRPRGEPAAHPHRLVRRGRDANARRHRARPGPDPGPGHARHGRRDRPAGRRRVHPYWPALDRVPLGAMGDGPWANARRGGGVAGRLRGDRQRSASDRPWCWPGSDGRPTTLSRDAAR